MKKKLLFAVLGLCLFSSSAFAEWKMTDVPWSHPGAMEALSAGSSGTTFVGLRGWLRDTLYIPMADSKVDTTGEWTMLDAEPVSPVEYGRTSTTPDTAIAGYVVLVPDSATASTIVWGAATAVLQVNYGRGANWQTLSSLTISPTSGSKQLFVPIITSTATQTVDLGPTAPPLTAFAPRMRLIFTGGASAAGPQTRVRVLKYYKNVVKAGRDFN